MLEVSYADRPARRGDELLAAVRYSTGASAGHGPHNIVVPLQGDGEAVEIWQCAGPVRSGLENGIAYRESDEALFGYVPLVERQFNDLEALGRDAYLRISELTANRGYPCLLRVWHYLPRINEAQAGLERYQRFCVGRQKAL